MKEENKLQNNFSLKLINSIEYFPKNIEGNALRAHCLLYEITLSKCPLYNSLNNLKLLEVGCGPGGGLNWIKNSHPEINLLYGLDKHPPPINNLLKGINVIYGKAEYLPFNNCYFDLILNIESSHCYGEKGEKKFFYEVNRVLKKGGYLCWADIRTSKGLKLTLEYAKQSKLKLISPLTKINKQVLHGIEKTSARYELLLKKAPFWIKIFSNNFRNIYAPNREKLENEEYLYLIGCWKKLN
ncbi:Methyltransf_11 domain-containing protein [Meloidogyne graminicola]|uniref:Methyltransf_11 domain-containing protein n=1 Tax=Meloidogyne graminicola TaxID=189291 RepID=A0A8S9ZK62_9BILA|nr:Methyltransf_11 domain-containing protein [Meloidogyne graminicola]